MRCQDHGAGRYSLQMCVPSDAERRSVSGSLSASLEESHDRESVPSSRFLPPAPGHKCFCPSRACLSEREFSQCTSCASLKAVVRLYCHKGVSFSRFGKGRGGLRKQ